MFFQLRYKFLLKVQIPFACFEYFDKHKLSNENLCNELKLAFSEEVSIDVNDEKEAVNNQLLVNSLEDVNNPYRIIFEVEKLDEGWDCLNLFDIVRLYEGRDMNYKTNKVGTSTTSEVQLIGRGVRYFPFAVEGKSKNRRKFDNDLTNELRVLEEFYFHFSRTHHIPSVYVSSTNRSE